MSKQQNSSGLVWLALGLSLGLVLLLNYSHVLTWEVWWRLLQAWPVAPIACWVEYLLNRRSRLGSMLASLLIVLTVGIVVLLSILTPDSSETPMVQAYPATSATHVQMTFKQSIGQVYVGPQWNTEHLISVTVSPGRGERTYRQYQVSGDSATFDLRARRRFAPAFISSGVDHRWKVLVQPTVTVSLDASLGVGENTFDLRQLSVERGDLNFAIGTLDLTLPQDGEGAFNIKGAIGTVRVVVPEGKAVRVHVETSLAAYRFPSTYIVRDTVYFSPSCIRRDTCTRLSIHLSVGEVLIVTSSSSKKPWIGCQLRSGYNEARCNLIS